jgi:hypothetical protein
MQREIVWEWLDRPGLEHLSLRQDRKGVVADGLVIVELEPGAGSIRLRYRLQCDIGWRIQSASLALEAGGDHRTLELARDTAGSWRVDGETRGDLDGCDEIDIQGTPFTNALPIRRLGLRPDTPHPLRVAYVLVPSLVVEAGEQEYTRLDAADPPRRFRYRNPENGFVAELQLDEEGLVTEYGTIWRRRGG